MRKIADEVIGLLAGLLTTISLIPQVRHSLRSRDLAGISLHMYLLYTIGVALWAFYGFDIGSWPVLVANLITFALASIVLFLKLKHK